MAKIRVFIEMIVDHNALVNPQDFPHPADLYDLGKFLLTDDIKLALDEDGNLDDFIKYDIISE